MIKKMILRTGHAVMAMREKPANACAADEALRWFVRLHSGNCVEHERRACEEWLAGSELRRLEYQKVEALWADMDDLTGQPFPELEQVRQSVRAGHWRVESSTALSGRCATVALAAALVAVVAGAWWWTMLRVAVTEYQTAKGEQRTVVLPEGSTITMNTDTALSVRLSGVSRTVVLKKGEALFTVSHDAGRPFDVLAGNGTARDLGTQFTVHKQPGRVVVTVLDGLVEVETHAAALVVESSASSGERKVLAKGERLRYGDDGRLGHVEPVETSTVTAWLHGKLVFEAMPLAEVAQEISRYRAGEIRLVDHSLGDLKVSGVFNARDTEGFLHALEKILPVRVTHVDGQLAIVEAAAPR